MRIRSVLLCLCLSVLVLSLAQPAAAQRAGNWAIGYSLLGNNDIAKNTSVLPLGWMGGGAVELSDGVSWAFDVSGNYAAGIDVCGGVESRAIGIASQPAACLEGVTAATTADEYQGYSNMRPEAMWCSPTLSKCDVKALSVGGFTGPRFGPTGGSVRPYVHIMGGAVRSARATSAKPARTCSTKSSATGAGARATCSTAAFWQPRASASGAGFRSCKASLPTWLRRSGASSCSQALLLRSSLRPRSTSTVIRHSRSFRIRKRPRRSPCCSACS